MPATCPLCHSDDASEIFGHFRPKKAAPTGRHTEDLFGRAGKIVRCDGCGLVRQADPPLAPYEDAGEDIVYLREEAGIRQTFRGVLACIERFRRPPGTLLDIGCGPGLLLDEARARGWGTIGVDPSGWGIDEARGRGLNVIRATLEHSGIPSASIDAVVATDVIEHVDDPVAFTRQIRDVLVPGGVVLIATPNVTSVVARVLRRWWWSIIPNHLWFFSPATLDAVLRKAALDPLQTTTHPKTFSVDYYAGRLAGYNALIGRAGRGLGRLIAHGDRLVTPDFRDRIAMLAVRRS